MIRYERAADGGLRVSTEVAVGVERVHFRLGLGRWVGPDPHPGGLRNAPVVVLPDPDGTDLARAGALRAGGAPSILILPADAPGLGSQLLLAVQERVEVILVEGARADVLELVRALRGRPLPALALGDPPRLAATFAGCRVDVNVPVPSLEGASRATINALLAPLDLTPRHHLVEVDPRPAFEEAGVPLDPEALNDLGAAAAGVLAGRLAASNRRWRGGA